MERLFHRHLLRDDDFRRSKCGDADSAYEQLSRGNRWRGGWVAEVEEAVEESYRDSETNVRKVLCDMMTTGRCVALFLAAMTLGAAARARRTLPTLRRG
jgi:hypothetical protein